MNFKSSIYRQILYAFVSGAFITLALQENSYAQQTKKLTLNEAITLSIQNSKQLKLSRTKIDQATASLKEAHERQLPDVSITGSYLRVNKPNVDLKLKLGSDSTGSGSSPNISQAAYTIASVSLPIFSGFMIQSAKASARYLAEATRLDADKNREDVIQNTIAAYSNLYKAKAAVALVKENQKESLQRVKDFTNLEQNGLLARNDLLKAQLQESNIELSLMDAESSLKIANINMDLLLGLPEDVELEVDASIFQADPIVDNKSVTEWEQLAIDSRKDAAALSAREKAADANIKMVRGEYYPSVAFTGGYIAAYIPNLLTITNAVNAGIGLKYTPSSLWKTGSKVNGAKAQLQEVQINESILADQIHLQINQSYQDYVLSRKKIDTYAKAIEQADENYRIVKNKQVNNLATTTDLLEADVADLQAKLNYAFAKADALVTYKKLLQSAGVLAASYK
jgi:outer membrane protein